MSSKILDEFLKKAPPETQAILQQTRQDLQRDGVQLNAGQQPPAANNVPSAEQASLQQIGQGLQQNGVQLKPDTYGPQTPARIGEVRPHAEIPKFMDEQTSDSLKPTGDPKAELRQVREDLQRDGMRVDQPTPSPKPKNAVDQALASTGKISTQSRDKQKEREPER